MDPINSATIRGVVIESLPSGPGHLIRRELFAIVEPPVSFRTQLIHFAGSLNYIEDVWSEFLSEFESAIRRMYWYGVELQIGFDQYGGEYTYLGNEN